MKNLGLFRLEKTSLRGKDLMTVFSYLKHGDKEDGDGLFSVVAGDRTRSNCLTLQ